MWVLLALGLALWLLLSPQLVSGSLHDASQRCQASPALPTSFGIYSGGAASPLRLHPLDLLNVSTATALSLANPVLTTTQLPGLAAISQPMLLPQPPGSKELHMFFAAQACASPGSSGGGRWGIAAAVSRNGGWVWKPLGWVLREEGAELRAPMVFSHENEWYMVVEALGLAEVRLYRAASFPCGWQLSRVLLNLPLRGVSIVPHEGQWWLIGSRAGNGIGGQDDVLAIFKAPSPLGPWQPHGNGTLAAEAGTSVGAAFQWKKQLHRLGRTCHQGVCGPVKATQLLLTDHGLDERPVQLELVQPAWRQRSRWDSAGVAALSIARRSDGAFLAVVEASQLPHVQPALPRQLQAAVRLFRGLALLSNGALLLTCAAHVPVLRGVLRRQTLRRPLLVWALWAPGSRQRCGKEAGGVKACQQSVELAIQSDDGCSSGESEGGGDGYGSSAWMVGPAGSRSSSSTSAYRRTGSSRGSSKAGGRPGLHSRASSSSSGGSSSVGQRLRASLRRLQWRPLLAAVILVLSLSGMWGSQAAARVAAPFAVLPAAVAVQGQYSRFTLLVMSYDKRVRELRWYIRHYSQCPSVGEVLVVWNRGAPPDPHSFDSAVPVRVRAEAANSMNNRFAPDPHLRFRSVLSLDDDILIPCSTIEATFATWRASPRRLLGFYPRLLLPDRPGGPPVYRFEEETFEKGMYSAILAGAAFMDSAYFDLYTSPATAPARALVDELFNCDDLLLNFVVANWTRAADAAAVKGPGARLPPAVQLVRPQRRLDLSRLSGVGISHDPGRFKAAADRCLAEFASLFGGSPLALQPVPDGYGALPNCRLWPLDCMYLADS